MSAQATALTVAGPTHSPVPVQATASQEHKFKKVPLAHVFLVFSCMDGKSLRALSLCDKALLDLTRQAAGQHFFRSCLPIPVYFDPTFFSSQQRDTRDFQLNLPVINAFDPRCETAKVRVITDPAEISSLHFLLKDDRAFDLDALLEHGSKVLSSLEFSDKDRAACLGFAKNVREMTVNKWEKADVGILLTGFIKCLEMPDVPLSKKKSAIQGLPHSQERWCAVPFFSQLERIYVFLLNPEDQFLKSTVHGWIGRSTEVDSVKEILALCTYNFAHNPPMPSYRPYLNCFFENHLSPDQDLAKYFKSNGDINERGVAFVLEKMGFLTADGKKPL
jgi:hypothetical protein